MKFLFLFFFCCWSFLVFAQNATLRYEDRVYQDHIKTAMLYRQGWQLSYPYINLNSGEQLELSFDDIATKVNDYYYTVIHCDSEWKPSNLLPMEYIDGFTENKIEYYTFSQSANIDYVNYRLSFPNSNCKPKLSGNYLLVVYENQNKDEVILTKRFSVVEQKVTIKGTCNLASITEDRLSKQELDFTVDISNNPVSQPYVEIKTIVLQNNRWDKATVLNPTTLNGNVLMYRDITKNSFEAGNEYQHFDTKSARYKEMETERINYEFPFYHFYLVPDKPRAYSPYEYNNQDINGRFIIRRDDRDSCWYMADYVKVHFVLSYPNFISDGKVYVLGQFSNWNTTKDNEMTYNFDKQQYELTMTVKQGYYNYQYACVTTSKPTLESGLFEGNHSETENEYVIYAFEKSFSKSYEKLIGVQIINSLKKK